ncbi:MAG: hypothetical protein HC896_03850 [Bacteroidales bacterium]|nr:hypothetical protein [Bacteroidales bacterium]
MESNIALLRDRYGRFLDLYSLQIINIGLPGNPAYADYLTKFVTDYAINQVKNDVEGRFDNFDVYQNRLEMAFRHYKFYFPEKNIPHIITYISGFNHSMAVDSGFVGIGLDKYMGAHYGYYTKLGIEAYARFNMHADKIASDCMKAWAATAWPYGKSTDNLIDQMIYNGKIAYFTKCMLPNEPDSLIMGFTADEMKFCRNNEEKMWIYLIENKLLFSTDMLTISKFINDAPFTKGFSTESPGRAAIWIGWRIVESYMHRNKGTSLQTLMDNQHYQQILAASDYHP